MGNNHKSNGDGSSDPKKGSTPRPNWNDFSKGEERQRKQVRGDHPTPKPGKPPGSKKDG